MRQFLFGLTLLYAIPSLANIDDFLAKIEKAKKLNQELAVVLNDLSSKTSVGHCSAETFVYYDATQDSDGLMRILKEKERIKESCLKGQSETAGKVKECAEAKAIEVCEAKGYKNCSSATLSTTFEAWTYMPNVDAKITCKAKTVIISN